MEPIVQTHVLVQVNAKTIKVLCQVNLVICAVQDRIFLIIIAKIRFLVVIVNTLMDFHVFVQMDTSLSMVHALFRVEKMPT